MWTHAISTSSLFTRSLKLDQEERVNKACHSKRDGGATHFVSLGMTAARYLASEGLGL